MNSGCERHPADGAPWVVGRKVSPRVAWTELPLAVVGEHSRQHGRRHRLRCHSLAATTLTSDPALIAGLSLAYSLVRILLVVPVGVVVDRVDRRLLMWASNVIRGAIFVGVSVFFAVGAGDLLLLYAAFVLVGVMEIVADNAAISVLPDVVDAGNLDRTNGRVATTQLVADEFAGPPFGGFALRGCCMGAVGCHRWPLRRCRAVLPGDAVPFPTGRPSQYCCTSIDVA